MSEMQNYFFFFETFPSAFPKYHAKMQLRPTFTMQSFYRLTTKDYATPLFLYFSLHSVL